MEHYLNKWTAAFPKLLLMLNDEEKEILDTIDPMKYIDYNITRETEIIRIINDHKPQAWKWVRLYPSMKDLPAEDYEILDHINSNDFTLEVTEEDLRRIITYRKKEIRRKKDEEEIEKAHAYYLEHTKEIEKEKKTKSTLDSCAKWLSVLGVSITSAGVAMIETTINPLPYFIIGIPLIILPWLAVAIIEKKMDAVSVAPKPVKIDAKLDAMSIIFLISFYIGLIGVGIVGGTLFVWGRLGWDSAETVFHTGLYTIVGAAALFFISLIISADD